MTERIEVRLEGLNPRHIDHIAAVLIRGGLIAYPTDSGYALGWRAGNRKAQEQVIRIRQLDQRHHFTYCCRTLSDVGNVARVDNWAYRLIRQVTPGPFTFILPATSQVPKLVKQRKTHTIGIRIPDHAVVQAMLKAMDEPLLSSSLLLPGMAALGHPALRGTSAWPRPASRPVPGLTFSRTMDDEIFDSEDLYDAVHGLIDLFVDAGYCPLEPTTLVDLSGDRPVILRQGRGVLNS